MNARYFTSAESGWGEGGFRDAVNPSLEALGSASCLTQPRTPLPPSRTLLMGRRFMNNATG